MNQFDAIICKTLLAQSIVGTYISILITKMQIEFLYSISSFLYDDILQNFEKNKNHASKNSHI